MHIGMRIPGLVVEKGIDEVVRLAQEAGLQSVDLNRVDREAVAAFRSHGLDIGTVDLKGVGQSLIPDDEKRERAVSEMLEQVDQAADLGIRTLFCHLSPEGGATPRAATFEVFVKTYPRIVAHVEKRGLSLAMEPYPGRAPHYAAIGCTPEMYRAIFAVIDSPALGICYDPSHYVRLGIDYLRVLDEFGDRVRHVHGKDTEVLSEGRYLYGTAGPTFALDMGWCGGDWRYCIPGSGDVDWARVIAHLKMKGYDGAISIELEDHVYGYTFERNREGVIAAARRLRSVI